MTHGRKRLLVSIVALGLLVLMVALVAGLFTRKIEPGLEDAPIADVTGAYLVRRVESPFTESVPGSVEAKEATIISSRLIARIETIRVRAGDYVEQGQLLLQLEKGDLLARAQQATEKIRSIEARRAEAGQNLKRAEELHQRGLLAVADRDAARANAATLEAELAAARQALEEAETLVGFTEIHSPISGRVVDRFAEPGDTASPGQKLLSLYNPFSLRVEAQIRERLALSLHTGDELQVELPTTGGVFNGHIEEIVPAADPGSRTFLVKVVVPSAQNLLPGMYARLQVPAGSRSRVLVPTDRVARVGQLDVVWVAVNGTAERRFVRLGGAEEEGMIEVLSGLEPGDRVLPLP